MELWRVVRRVDEAVVHPILRRLLRSPLHWPLSEWYCLVDYDDEVSGQRQLVPVGYSRTNDVVHVVEPRERTVWWRQFRDGDHCTLYLDGEPVAATGEVVTNALKHESHVTDFLHPVPALAGPGGESGLDEADFTNYVLVEFALDSDTAPDSESATEIPVESGRSR